MNQLWYKFLVCLLLIALLAAAPAFAGNGKISGVVKGQDGEPVAGANVVLEGTSLGGSADVTGKYFILNVPPGNYNVRASAVSFTPRSIQNVRVGSDQIVTVDFMLQGEAVGMSEVVVQAQRPPVDKSQTSARTTIQGDEFQSLPLSGVQALVATSASTYRGFVRGGKQFETKTIIDGVDVTDEYYAASVDNLATAITPFLTYNGIMRQEQAKTASLMNLNLVSVEEANVLTGGVGSDYSSATAGLVSYTLREGRGPLAGRVDFRMSQPNGLSHNGPDLYYDQARYMAQKNTLANSAQAAERDKSKRFTWYPGKYSYGQKPETKGEAAIGGNLLDNLGLYFTAGYFNSYGRLPNEFTRRINSSLKVNYNITSDIKLTGVGILEDRGKLFGWKNRTYADDFRYFLEGVPQWNGVNFVGSLKFTHVLTPSTFYEIQASEVYDNSLRGFSDDNNNGIVELGENGDFITFADTATVNRYMAKGTGNDLTKFFTAQPRNESASEVGITMSGASNWKVARPGIYYENFKNSSLTLKGDFTSQVTQNHQLRAGVQARLHNLDMTRRSSYIGGVFSTYRDYVEEIWKVKPKEYAAYVQDRMEYAGLIINAGLRFDGLDLNASDYANFFAPFQDITDANGGKVRVPVRGDKIKMKTFISPRLGVSHPISDRAAMYFSFSRQQQSQPMSRLFIDYNDFGNPSLPVVTRVNEDPIRSTNYDLGVQWSFADDYGLDVNAYYKDVQNYANTSFVVTPRSPWRLYYLNTNFGYADARGVEFTLRKNITPVASWLSIGGRVSYAYSYVKQSVGAGANVNTFSTAIDSARFSGGLPFDDIKNWNTIEQNVLGGNSTLTGGYDRPHRVAFTMFMRFPYEITLSSIGTFQSGFFYRISLGDPRARELGTAPWDKQVDFRLEKAFSFSGVGRVAVYVDLINAFNWTNILAYNTSEVGQIAFERNGDPTGGPTIQRAVTQDGSMVYDVPREIYFGVNFQF